VSLRDHLLGIRHELTARISRRKEADRATRYWASLRSYHETNDGDSLARERSTFVAEVLVPELELRSLLEVGTNSGRNLGIVKQAHPAMRVKGIDVNPRAIAHARERYPDVEFSLQDANDWVEPPSAWDGVLTMSLLDHVPDAEAAILAANMAVSAHFVVCFELWDGADGERALYKYSRDNRRLFESIGLRTRRWELAPGQYDLQQSELWLYVGEAERSVGPGYR
jgi:SAM-dependent methyltransferase